MIEQLPTWIDVLFIASAIYTIVVFHYTNDKPIKNTGLIILWSVAHSILAYLGFYENTMSLPPRFGLVIIPLIIMLILVIRNQKNSNSSNRTLWKTSLIHIVRIPVELTLYYLFVYKAVPELMTFAGRNFDILAGLTAPIIAFLLYKKLIGRKVFLIWNMASLVLLAFIVANAILSVESPFQQFAFDQPNRALSYFPYILLPATVAPLVMYTHVVDILNWKKPKH